MQIQAVEQPSPKVGKTDLFCPSCGHVFTPRPEVHCLGPIEVGIMTGLVVNGEPRHVPSRVLKMLDLLVRAHPTPVSRERIMDALNMWEVETNGVAVMGTLIRQALAGVCKLHGMRNGWGWGGGGCSYSLELLQ